MKVKIKKLHVDAQVPKYQTELASGFDLHSVEEVKLVPGETKTIKTGLSFEIPPGYEMQVRPRSGYSLKTKVRIANTPGTVDADFRGEVCIIVDNLVTKFPSDHIIMKGERIAQGVIQKVEQAEFEVVEELTETARGSSGYGSTGKL